MVETVSIDCLVSKSSSGRAVCFEISKYGSGGGQLTISMDFIFSNRKPRISLIDYNSFKNLKNCHENDFEIHFCPFEYLFKSSNQYYS
jgi:hypothetical protein